MDDEALDELDARLTALREQALEQIALSQKVRLALDRAAGGAPRGAAQPPTRRRAPRPRIPGASASASANETSWRALGARLRHRMRLA